MYVIYNYINTIKYVQIKEEKSQNNKFAIFESVLNT